MGLYVDTAFIVGAGFSHHAGLPLTSKVTEAILEARGLAGGPNRVLVDFLSKFIRDAFDHSARAGARYWPDLEDVFTCVDLSANSGHYLGAAFAPADLRTVRRAMLSRIIRMLEECYQRGRRKKGRAWRQLDKFFCAVSSRNVGFISMNWDTVIERKLAIYAENCLYDYCCDGIAAVVPDLSKRLEIFQWGSPQRARRAYLKEVRRGCVVSGTALPFDRGKVDRSMPVVKIHGSINWLYCDNCRQLYWFHPNDSRAIADQLIREDDVPRVVRFLSSKNAYSESAADVFQFRPRLVCQCSKGVPLGTRIATFSYRKALDFPMFQKSWFAAEELLRAANRWVFIGYSLPAADYEFKYLLKRIQLSRRSEPEFFVISGGTAEDVSRAYDNYQRFFGRRVSKSCFFSAGLTNDAISAVCD